MAHRLTELIPTLQYSSTDSELEIMLKQVVQFQLDFLEEQSSRNILPGENLHLELIVKPNFETKKKNYTKLFKVLCAKNQDSMKIWKKIFSRLEIHVSLETELPNSSKFEIVENKNEKRRNSTFIPKHTEKKGIDSNSALRTYVNTKEKEDSISFELNINIPTNQVGEAFLVLDCYLPSYQFDEYVIRTLSDSDSSLDKFEKLIPYETSKLYIEFNLFLGTICKPILIQEALKISSKSKFLNKTSIIECSFENLTEQELTISSIDLQTMSIGVKEINRKHLNNLVISNEKKFNGSVLKATPLIGKSLFNFILDKNCLPMILNPGEISTIIFQIIQNHATFENSEDEEKKNPFSQFSSLLTAQYQIEGLKSTLSNHHSVKWNFIKNTGFVFSLDSPETIFVNEDFNAALVIKNFTSKKCNLDILISLSAESPLICRESKLNVGVLEPNQIKKLNLHYSAIRSGIFDLFEIQVVDKLTNKTYESICQHKIYIQEKIEKSIGGKIERKEMVEQSEEDTDDEKIEVGLLTNDLENSKKDRKQFSMKAMPVLRGGHQRSHSTDIMSPFPTIFNNKKPLRKSTLGNSSSNLSVGKSRRNLLNVRGSNVTATTSYHEDDEDDEESIDKTDNDVDEADDHLIDDVSI
eukprot:gene7442-11765_t